VAHPLPRPAIQRGTDSWIDAVQITRVSPAENLEMIADSVAYLVSRGKRVVYDAEHFFDAWRDDAVGALDCLRAARSAGAVIIIPV